MRLFLLLAGTVSLASAPAPFFHRGVNFTAENRVGYSLEGCAGMLDRLAGYGVNAVALVPYGACRRNETVIRFNFGMERADLIEAVARAAHGRGMRVFLKPQIWVPDGGFPGDLEFASEALRAAWFRDYTRFLEFYARLAARIHADLFCVGVEFVRLTRYEREWRTLIARARELYTGPLIYAATQGEEFETLRFWDALDYIGLNEYYPLPDDLSTVTLVETVERVERRFRKPVIFTEAGFSTYQAPHRAPWDETPRALAPAEQARSYEALFRAFYRKPWFHGVYWWKVGTNGYGGPRDGSHTPWGKPAMEVIGRWYLHGGR